MSLLFKTAVGSSYIFKMTNRRTVDESTLGKLTLQDDDFGVIPCKEEISKKVKVF